MSGLQGLTLRTQEPQRIAAYCRVSTDKNNQEDSFETQKQFFEREIKNHPQWTLAGIYADQAKSGRQIKGRTDFQRMMRHAEAHQFDYIISKSISRFSRSATDTLRCLGKLHDLGVGVYFLEQGYDTEAPGSQIVLDMLASIAEYESHSISQNLKITLDAMNERGTPVRKCSYGFDKIGTEWEINQREAVRVKLGFLMAANGFSFAEICAKLNQFEEKDRSGREWDHRMVKRMLLNEVYVGDIVTNKNVIVHQEDRSKAEVKNDGIVDQYYIDCHHEPIIGRSLWEKVRDMCVNRELAGQEKFHGVDKVRGLASRDRLLEEVRKYMPRTQGRWMKKLEERNG